ncbi:MAG: aminotransferase class IV [Candidatus Cyclobacteriaceae bacterium M2_1C_046]
MWVWYNDRLLQEKDLILHTSNRAFQYGDGIFETIIIENGQINYAEYHKTRIINSTRIMHLDFKLNFKEFTSRVQFLLQKNKLQNARAKLIIWRAPGGYYIPEKNDSEFMITLNTFNKKKPIPQRLGVSREIRIPKGLTKNCKTLNALPYILAGLELKNYPEFDDFIILDNENNVSECISSNLFWIKDNEYFTPSLESNCIMGVRRSFIIDELKEKGIMVNEVLASVDELLQADSIYKTNVTGVHPVKSIGDKEFEVSDDPLLTS